MTTEMSHRVFNICAIILLALSLAFVSTTTASAQSTSPIHLNPGQSATITITLPAPASGVAAIKYTVKFTADSKIEASRKECVGTSATHCSWEYPVLGYPLAINDCPGVETWWKGYSQCLNIHLNPMIKAFKTAKDKTLTITWPSALPAGTDIKVTVQ